MILQANLSYSKPAACVLDLYIPESPEPKPLIVMLHGGGWVSGDKSMYAQEARAFCVKGYACATIGYRLAPLDLFPAAIVDCQRAVKFLSENGERLGYDARHIYSFGNSAGGHLATMVGLVNHDLETNEATPTVKAVVAISPISDVRQPSESHYPIAYSFLEQFMGVYHEENPKLWSEASPITYVHPGAPPFLIFHGTEDDVVPFPQSQALYDALIQSGASAEFYPVEGEGHAFSMDSWENMMTKIDDFLKTV